MISLLQISNETIFASLVSPLIVYLIVLGSRGMISLLKKTKVLVHQASFINSNDSKTYYFIKVQNRSLKNPVTITHVWVRGKTEQLHLLNQDRPLPRKLEPSDEWETWIDTDSIIDKRNIYKNVRVKLTNETILRSKHNKKVPSVGSISGP